MEGISGGAGGIHPGINVTAAAPGISSTNFASAGSYQSSKRVMDIYEPSVGKLRHFLGQLDGNQPGDPVKLATVITRLAESENPPLHLPIGKDAIAAFRTKTENMQKKWMNGKPSRPALIHVEDAITGSINRISLTTALMILLP